MSTWKGGQHLDDSPGNPRQSDEAYLGTVKPDVGEVLPEGLLLGTVLHVPTSRGEDPLGGQDDHGEAVLGDRFCIQLGLGGNPDPDLIILRPDDTLHRSSGVDDHSKLRHLWQEPREVTSLPRCADHFGLAEHLPALRRGMSDRVRVDPQISQVADPFEGRGSEEHGLVEVQNR